MQSMGSGDPIRWPLAGKLWVVGGQMHKSFCDTNKKTQGLMRLRYEPHERNRYAVALEPLHPMDLQLRSCFFL